ncbi:baseplate J/gp47 family protein [Pseudenhygromyxa sp. WMMC2535]|uniref:baseplate J/gp47 family protein n=1 Tax=Pseudenhygromyxa sp. WMMC2535 TaxID=2712867 RepID=UPI001551CD3D|nr:baseplate J/gp47 family protein [Pseudenhygromyxa sp. WMMC2535]NVB36417.1 baseplate J/gp47 family protein [Pseudenhygromyxa sp. WMMC2535]
MAEDRLTLLRDQDPKSVTGIDFVAVVDPAVQDVLRVFFLIEPDHAELAWGTAGDAYADLDNIRIWAPSGGKQVAEPKVEAAAWLAVGDRVCLELSLAEPGDFSLYRLRIDDAKLDYYYKEVEFSFKQACPSTLDCKQVAADDSCPEDEDELTISPLARDFVSLRRALLDYTSQKYPDWSWRSDADVGVMMLELMAAMGDEFNYIKDRFLREGVLDELSQRRSLRQLIRLLDYELHDGLSPSTLLELDIDTENDVEFEIAAGTRVWAQRYGESPVPFEIGEGLADVRTGELGEARTFVLREAWNTLSVHEPDGDTPKLARGATELYLIGQPTEAADKWPLLSRALVLHEDPSDGSAGKRHLVHVTECEFLTDPLDPVNTLITRVAWSEDEALPCAMVIADTTVKANVVPATAGQSFTEFFSVRGDGTTLDVVERGGPLDAITGVREPVYRYSPRSCEAAGLGWLGDALRSASPEIEVQEVDAVDDETWNPDGAWTWRRTLLSSTADDEHFTLEDGTWRRIIGYRLPDGGELVHQDWAANAGYTIRFGDGEFGRIPTDGTVFRVRYRSGPGSAANFGAGTLVHLVDPVEGGAPAYEELVAVSNPFAITSGVDPESMTRAKLLAPHAFRHDPLMAVGPEDYKRLAETLDWVQTANATFRWTGSWMTVFVAADPKGAYAMTAAQQAELEDLMDSVRQLGRDVHVVEPDYVDLDVDVDICVAASYYAGQVEAEVVAALVAFFDPDRFTFGTPLRRSALEAAIQRVSGVRAVHEVMIRAREKGPWIELLDGEFEVGSGQVIRVANDRALPERGTVKVRAREVV